MLRELPPTAGLEPLWSDLRRPAAGIPDLTAQIAAFLKVPDVLMTCSGTAALVIAFDYLKRRSRRRTVIVPGYTCPLVVLAAERAGLKVALCDTVPGRLELDPADLARLLDADALCVVATHYGGYLTDIAALRALVTTVSPETMIIEDAAQAFGAEENGHMTGTDGHIGIFSFAAGKGLSLFEGGCLCAKTPEIMAGLRETAREITGGGGLVELRRSLELCAYYALYNPFGLYFSYGMPRRFHLRRGDPVRAIGDLFAAPLPLHTLGKWRQRIGQNALPRLPDHLASTRQQFAHIAQRVQAAGLDPNLSPEGRLPSCTFLFATFPTRARCEAALEKLWPSGLGISKLFAHALGEYAYLADRCLPPTPNAADFAARTMTISTTIAMRDSELNRILAAIAA